MKLKSEAPESKDQVLYLQITCPLCSAKNFLIMSETAKYDIEVCVCHNCHKKFWLPGAKELHEDMIGFNDESTEEDIGLNPGEDLIEGGFDCHGLDGRKIFIAS